MSADETIERLFTVEIEARKRGAIGVFSRERRQVSAASPLAALDAARNQLNGEGFETRNPVSVRDSDGRPVT